EIEADRYDLESTRPLGDGEALPVKSATPLVALHAIAKALPEMMEKRKEIQERRRRTDAEIFSRFGESWGEPASGDLGAEYQKIQRELFGIFDIAGATRPEGRSARRILIVSTDYVGEEMAGPAIRCWEFARQLAPEFSVTLAIPNQTSLKPEGFRIFSYSDKNHAEFRSLAAERDVILVQGWALYHLSFLKTLRKIFIVDLYCPFPIENLNTYRYNEMGEEDRRRAHALNLIIANEQILMGDFFLCANERQRDYWLGVLSALNRLNVETFDHDTSLEKMIATVPFGIPDTAPCKGRHAIKGRVKGIGPEDKVILWAGGIFNWFDPETLIHAMDQVSRKRPDVKLFFLGTRHPNPEVPRMRVQEQAMALSKELGLHGRIVFFNEKGYVPYADRLDYLLDSDFGVSTHRRGVEARLASRTRFMDYLWSGLPIICTEGDALAEMVDREGLGLVVPAGDPDALATAILRLVEKPDEVWAIREKIERVREEFVWSRVVAPLREFCRNPSFAPDKGPERAVLPGLHRLHREKPLKEGAVREIGEKLETQDQARRRAERVADARSIQIVSSKQRETDLAGQVAKKDQQMQSLEAQLQAKRRAMSDMATHIRNIEALLQEERETTGDEGNGWLGKIRQWMGKGSAEKES
ncbi:MAG: glycosyltransferase, partial [Planctomycetota bacterium]|nr:glycosyltransferase [Planctomycetota bacterium]